MTLNLEKFLQNLSQNCFLQESFDGSFRTIAVVSQIRSLSIILGCPHVSVYCGRSISSAFFLAACGRDRQKSSTLQQVETRIPPHLDETSCRGAIRQHALCMPSLVSKADFSGTEAATTRWHWLFSGAKPRQTNTWVLAFLISSCEATEGTPSTSIVVFSLVLPCRSNCDKQRPVAGQAFGNKPNASSARTSLLRVCGRPCLCRTGGSNRRMHGSAKVPGCPSRQHFPPDAMK